MRATLANLVNCAEHDETYCNKEVLLVEQHVVIEFIAAVDLDSANYCLRLVPQTCFYIEKKGKSAE